MGQTKRQKIAVFDCDGVLADFEGAFCEAFGNKNRHLYNLSARYPEVDPDLISEWVNDEENYRHLNPIFGGITLLNQVKSRGFKVSLLTSRPSHLEKVTKDWLGVYNIPHDDLRGAVVDKAEFLYLGLKPHVEASIFVDDDVKNLEAVKFLFPNCVCLAWAQPWNDGYFPRATYDRESMKVMVNMGDNVWKWIWSRK